ncbi:10031_t:CDS:1, partial [Gigaspora rosea]
REWSNPSTADLGAKFDTELDLENDDDHDDANIDDFDFDPKANEKETEMTTTLIKTPKLAFLFELSMSLLAACF